MRKTAGELSREQIMAIEIVSISRVGAYNAIEVGIATFNSFSSYRGLYLWSMQNASWGILLHSLPAQIRYMSQAPKHTHVHNLDH